MLEIQDVALDVFGRFIENNGLQPVVFFEESGVEHAIFSNGKFKLRFSCGVYDRLREATVCFGRMDAPNDGRMWYPLSYTHNSDDPWRHIGDFKVRMSDEEYQAWLMSGAVKEWRPPEMPTPRGDLRRALQEVIENTVRISDFYAVQIIVT